MIKSLIKKFFNTSNKQDVLLEELKTIPGFTAKNKIDSEHSNSPKIKISSLEKGEILPILLPEFGHFKNFKVTQWHFQIGDLIKKGDVICEIENEKIVMEFESTTNGKIISMCMTNKILETGEELFKVEGV